MAIEQANEQSILLDALYCEEDYPEECLAEETNSQNDITQFINKSKSSLFPLFLVEQDLFWEDEELTSLFTKEKQTHCSSDITATDPFLAEARRSAVEWILKVNARYGFSALTAILAINYLDRFLSCLRYQQDKPWMIQLSAVTCLSLAAKVEEIDVPLLLDLQVEDANYVFDAKTIQRMELLVLSTLKWRMNPVTPLSFLDHIIRRLGLKNHLHWEFLRRCETLLLTIVLDSRFVGYPPSILGTATMLHVIRQIEPSNPVDYQNQLLDVLKISKDNVNSCYERISQLSHGSKNSQKRKYNQNYQAPKSSINGGVDSLLCSDSSSNDSWEEELSSVYSSPENSFKKRRFNEQKMRLPSLSCRVFVDAVSSPH